MSKGFASNYRIVLLAAGILLSFAGVGARLVDLHVYGGSDRIKSANKARRQIAVLQARRGEILDARGDALAINRPEWQLGVDPQSVVPGDESKWPQLAQLTGVPVDEIERLFRRKKTPGTPPESAPAPAANLSLVDLVRAAVAASSVRSAEPTPAEAAEPTPALDAVEAAPAAPPAEGSDIRWAGIGEPVQRATYDQVMALGIKGVYANLVYRRVYPQGQRAAHLIGFVNKGAVPVAGIEAAFDFYLRGRNGWREGEQDGRKRELAQFRSRDVPAKNGYNLTLSLDSAVQGLVEEELDAIARKFNPESATIIVSDARTGFILGLGNYPTFNLNEYNLVPKERQASMKNIAVTNQLDPGSTFKIVAASGALNEGLVGSSTRFDCTLTGITWQGQALKFMPDDHHFEAPLSVAEIISHSSNVGAAQLGLKLGPARLYAYARLFGFGERSGLGFGGEINGALRAPDTWKGNDYTRIPAGYSISATPMQIHYAMGTIASGGLLLQPQVVREIRDPSGEIVYRFDTTAKRRVVSADTARTMAQLLMGVASPGGTAAKAAIDGFQVAGKTGTAQKLIHGQYSDTNHVASFSGFFPATDPKVVVTVIVDDAKVPGGGVAYGAVVAVPAFRELAVQLIQYLDIRAVPGSAQPGRLLAQQGGPR